MDLELLADRSIRTLSNGARLKASFLFDSLDNKFDFMMCDCERTRPDTKEKRIKSKDAYFTIAEYFRKCDQFEFALYDLVWITDLPVQEMLEHFGNLATAKDYSFFELDGLDVVEMDKKKLLSDFSDGKLKVEPEKKIAPKEPKQEVPKRSVYKTNKTAFEAAKSASVKKEEPKIEPPKPKTDVKPKLEVIQVQKMNNEYMAFVHAHLKEGTITSFSKLRSLRNGDVYHVTPYPIDATYHFLKESLEKLEAEAEDIFEKEAYSEAFSDLGYDVEKIKNFDSEKFWEKEESLSPEERFSKTISADDSGPMTCVAFRVMFYENKEIDVHNISTNFDIKEDDILVGI